MMEYPTSLCAGEVITVLGQVIAQKGRDHCYVERPISEHANDRAHYAYGGEPDCLWGHYLCRIGVPAHRLPSCVHLPIHWVMARLGILIPPGLAYRMRCAQVEQDIGLPWGSIFDRFCGGCLADADAGMRL